MRTKARRPSNTKDKLSKSSRVARAATKTTDDKGRIALGARFANRTVIIEDLNENEVIVKLARVIPEREAWLYKNPAALKAVRDGIAQARAGHLVKGPDIEADSAFAARLED